LILVSGGNIEIYPNENSNDDDDDDDDDDGSGICTLVDFSLSMYSFLGTYRGTTTLLR